MMAWIAETQDFPENTFCDERYEELVMLEEGILSRPEDPRTVADIEQEIRRHIKEGRTIFSGGARRKLIAEWQQHFCTLWEMRCWAKRKRKLSERKTP